MTRGRRLTPHDFPSTYQRLFELAVGGSPVTVELGDPESATSMLHRLMAFRQALIHNPGYNPATALGSLSIQMQQQGRQIRLYSETNTDKLNELIGKICHHDTTSTASAARAKANGSQPDIVP